MLARTCFAALCLFAPTWAQDAEKPKAPAAKPKPPAPVAPWKAVQTRYDLDGNGTITWEEWQKVHSGFAALDANRDGKISAEEIKKRTSTGPAAGIHMARSGGTLPGHATAPQAHMFRMAGGPMMAYRRGGHGGAQAQQAHFAFGGPMMAHPRMAFRMMGGMGGGPRAMAFAPWNGGHQVPFARMAPMGAWGRGPWHGGMYSYGAPMRMMGGWGSRGPWGGQSPWGAGGMRWHGGPPHGGGHPAAAWGWGSAPYGRQAFAVAPQQHMQGGRMPRGPHDRGMWMGPGAARVMVAPAKAGTGAPKPAVAVKSGGTMMGMPNAEQRTRMAGMMLGRGADADQDGTVTADEFKKLVAAASGDKGGVSVAKLVGKLHGGANVPESAARSMTPLFDHDQDGKVEASDLEAIFKALDKDKDGKLTRKELGVPGGGFGMRIG